MRADEILENDPGYKAALDSIIQVDIISAGDISLADIISKVLGWSGRQRGNIEAIKEVQRRKMEKIQLSALNDSLALLSMRH